MKKLLLLSAFFIGMISIHAQDEAAEATKEGWKKSGNISLLFNQSSFNANWTAGGVSNIAGNIGLNYDFNYAKGDNVWDNKLIAAYGLTKIKGAENTTKTDDRIEFNSLYGKKAKGFWFYSAFLNFKTQMDVGVDANGDVTTHFFSPAYLQVGPGMLWKKSDNLKVNIAPATARLIFVHDEFTNTAVLGVSETDFNATGGAFGVEANETSRFEFGASLGGYYKVNLMENVTLENILNLYANYLDKPQNIDVDYTANLVMKINKYLSANVAFQAIYDDNTITNTGSKGVQVREVFGLGINYGF